ncbi:MAG: hypothetical protein AAF321_01565 [Pseudomonadota bacterium]
MFLNLVAAIVGGLALAGVAMALARTFRIPVPRWLYPVLIGIGMLGMNVYLEYSWYGRTLDGLPDRVAVLETGAYSGPLQPWTLLAPRINRFTALDRASLRTNPAAENIVLAEIFYVGRLNATVRTNQFIDCEGQRTALADDRVTFGEDGVPDGATWTDVEAGAPILAAACP